MERRSALASLILLAACGGAPGDRDDPGSGELTVDWRIDSETSRPREGDLGTLVLSIRNGTDRVAVLRNIRFLADPRAREAAGAEFSWQVARAGRLTYERGRDVWIYDRRKAAERHAEVFNRGLLLPGETIVVRTRMRLLHFPRSFHLLYFPLTPTQLRQKIYWEVRRGRETVYQTLLGESLRERLVPVTGIEAPSHRVVVFPHAEGPGTRAEIRVVRVDAPLAPRAFSQEEAAERSGLRPPWQVTYTNALRGWVFRNAEGTVLVTPDGRTPLPDIRHLERTFHYVDAAGVGKLEVELRGPSVAQAIQERGHRLVRLPPNPRDPPAERRSRYFVFPRAFELPKLFEDVRALKLAVDVELTANGGGRLQVVHPD